MNWKYKHLINRLLWGLGIGVPIPLMVFLVVNAWFNVYVAPLFGVKLVEVLEVPVLNLVFAVFWFLFTPALCVFSITLIIVGVKIIFDL